MNSRSETLRNTLFSSVGVYTEYLLGMLVSILIARHLGPADFGIYSLVVWLVACGVTLTNAGTTTTTIKFVAELRGSQRTELIPTLMRYLRRAQSLFLLVLLGVGSIVFLLFADDVLPTFNRFEIAALLVFCIALRSNYMLNIAAAKGFERFGATATIAAYSAPVNLALVVIADLLHGPVEMFLAVFAISSLVFYAVSLWQVRSFAPRVSSAIVLPPDLLKRIHRHMVFAALISSIAFFTASETEVLFLNLMSTPAEAGFFKVAYQLASGACVLLPGVFSAILLPLLAKSLGESKALGARKFRNATTFLVILAAPLVGFGFVFSGDVILVLYGKAYVAAAPVLAWCLFGYASTVVSSAANGFLMSADHQHSVLARVSFCGVMKILLDFILISYFDLIGAVIAFVSVALIAAVITIVLAMRLGETQLAWGRLIRIVGAVTAATLLSMPLHMIPMPAVAMVAGCATLTVLYAIFTLVFGCWTAEDIAYLGDLHKRIARGRPQVIAKVLDWAQLRAQPD